MKTKNNKRNRKTSSSTFCLLVALIITGFGALAAENPARDESAGEDADKTLVDETPPPKQPREKEPAAATELEEMIVIGRPMGEVGYSVPNATTATKTDTPIMETPISIQVVPQQVLRDQQVIRLEDVAKNVSGVQRDWGYGDTYENFIIRGFDSRSGTYRDGVRFQFHGFETASLERVEILKGPAAVLYGRIEPGGLVNLVTKRPLEAPYYSLQQQFGSFDLYRTTVDATGSINQDQSLLYRFNLAYHQSDSFRDFIFNDRVFVAPALSWRPWEDTEFNLNLEYRDGEQVDDYGIPAIGNRPAPIPISRFLGEKTDHVDTESVLVDFNWSHRFNEAWTLRNRFLWYKDYWLYNELVPLFLDADERSLFRGAWQVDQSRETYAVNLDLTGKFHLFGMDHAMLLGGDYYHHRQDAKGFTANFGVFGPPIDIFSPVYGIVDTSRRPRSDFDLFFLDRREWYGVYFQDQITLFGNRVHVLGGGRYDWATAGTGFSTQSIELADAKLDNTEVQSEKFSPRVGLVYQPWSWLSFYGNYAESFGVNNGRSATGQPFAPETGTQYEVGVKTELLDKRLSSTLAFYHLTKENILTSDITTLDPFDRVAIGEARSQGIELDIAGGVTDALSIIGTYAFTDARITNDNSGNEGHRLAKVPEHSGSLWAKYEFLDPPVKSLSVGAGVYLVSQREGDNENTFRLPGYARIDAFVAHRWQLWGSQLTAQLNVNNLLDKEYFKTTNTTDGAPRVGIVPGEPLTVIGSIRVEF